MQYILLLSAPIASAEVIIFLALTYALTLLATTRHSFPFVAFFAMLIILHARKIRIPFLSALSVKADLRGLFCSLIRPFATKKYVKNAEFYAQ
jgi:hypothetical protein